jgi:hypothetical protein
MTLDEPTDKLIESQETRQTAQGELEVLSLRVLINADDSFIATGRQRAVSYVNHVERPYPPNTLV